MININDLSYRYQNDSEDVLKHISLTVKKGEWIALLGHNGSGKSTLARFLNALLIPKEGKVEINGLDTRDPKLLWEIRKSVGLVFQNPENQLVATTVRDDIAFGLENNGFPREWMEERIYTSAKIVGISDMLDEEPHRLSGGQKQRVAIAGVLAVEPAVIVLDEATSMLDPQGRKEVLQTIQTLNQKENITIVMITHDVNEAIFADRIVVMKDGEISRIGSPADVLTNIAFMESHALTVPFATRLKHILAKEGISLDQEILTMDDLVEELWKLKWKT